MNIIAGREVPKDRRTKVEISPNSVGARVVPRESNGSSGRTAALSPRLRFERYVLDLERGCLLADGEEIALRPKTFDFLRYLVANPGRLVSKDELLAAVWTDVVVSNDSIVQCITELRRALGDHDQRLIKTVQRRGYRFETPVSAEPDMAVRQSTSVTAEGDQPQKPARAPLIGPNRGRHGLIFGAVAALPLLVMATLASWWWSGSADPLRAAPPLSIAVLPFTNLSDDSGQEYLSDGVTQELTTELSRLPGLFVIAHATARTFKGREIDARQIGRDLNVRYLLGGSIRSIGEQVRVNAQLVSAESGATVWAERFERKRDELAVWEDEAVGRIANALNFRLTKLESERGLRERGGNPEAFDLTTRGWALIHAAKNPDNYVSARAHFQRALERDPEAVNALAGIAWTSAILVLDGWSVSPAQDTAAAEAAAAKALALNPNHVIAHHVRGFLFRMQGRTGAARDAFRTAIAINPNFAPGYAQLGATEVELGQPEAAISAVERAITLSPRDPSLGPWFAFVGMAELHLGKYQDAVSWLTRAIDTGTPIARHHAYLSSALALAGRLPEAQAALAEFRKKVPSETISTLRVSTKSTDAKFVVQQERFFEGLRTAGLPE
jgi:TolB-like protein/DNA-binding winged helix-turn-helix (wHTH) protein/Tfp pilus assembly protein PilF